GKGKELQKLLNGYMRQLSEVTQKKYAAIALDAKDSALYKNDPNQHGKNFTCLNFDHTPLGAALATLTQFVSEVVYAETNALEELSRNVGADDVKFDNLIPVVKPQSNIVAAGARYKAELFLAASSSGTRPQMTIDDRAIPVEDGIGQVDFLTSPGNYNKDGLAKKTFRAAIKMNMPGGKDTTFVEDIEYFVARPVIQVQSASVQALYLNCGNELNVQVPALGAAYNPSFDAKGGSVITGGGKGLITIVPQDNEVRLNVYNNKNLLGTQVFKVRTIPRPEINITSKGKVVNEKQGMPAPGPRSLEVKPIADESFKNFLPKDARYRVAQWEVSLARGSNAVKTKKVNGQEASLSELAALARPGDRLVIEVKKVERLNFKGKIEVVKMGTIIHTIPLT
ncbi:MAG: gliding motility protein GldM, partial [Bacteroidota bacterium]